MDNNDNSVIDLLGGGGGGGSSDFVEVSVDNSSETPPAMNPATATVPAPPPTSSSSSSSSTDGNNRPDAWISSSSLSSPAQDVDDANVTVPTLSSSSLKSSLVVNSSDNGSMLDFAKPPPPPPPPSSSLSSSSSDDHHLVVAENDDKAKNEQNEMGISHQGSVNLLDFDGGGATSFGGGAVAGFANGGVGGGGGGNGAKDDDYPSETLLVFDNTNNNNNNNTTNNTSPPQPELDLLSGSPPPTEETLLDVVMAATMTDPPPLTTKRDSFAPVEAPLTTTATDDLFSTPSSSTKAQQDAITAAAATTTTTTTATPNINDPFGAFAQAHSNTNISSAATSTDAVSPPSSESSPPKVDQIAATATESISVASDEAFVATVAVVSASTMTMGKNLSTEEHTKVSAVGADDDDDGHDKPNGERSLTKDTPAISNLSIASSSENTAIDTLNAPPIPQPEPEADKVDSESDPRSVPSKEMSTAEDVKDEKKEGTPHSDLQEATTTTAVENNSRSGESSSATALAPMPEMSHRPDVGESDTMKVKPSDHMEDKTLSQPAATTTTTTTSATAAPSNTKSAQINGSTTNGGDTKKTGMPKTPTRTLPKAPENMSDAQRFAWMEKELHAAHTLIMQLQHHDNVEEEHPGDTVMVELQANLEQEMNRRAEAENEARLAKAKAQKLEHAFKKLQDESDSKQSMLAHDLEKLAGEKSKLQREFDTIREERDEQARKEMALTTRLNAAKKKEAVKANAAEHYEDQVDQLEKQVADYQGQLEAVTKEREQLRKELGEWKNYAERRTKQLETALNDEKKLNDERKRKMKSFVEAKTEEVRSARSDNSSLQTELDQTSHSLKELNQRYKQLHAQWVQSQTRNRELQRDMTKMKKDSEKMSKVGGTLEAKLSRSAQESEDHKHKRIQAKHELMSVLGQLENEKAINNRLRESLKISFTPKALSQQQTIQETLDDFEGALIKLSNRLGRPLPPPPTRDSLLDTTLGSVQDATADDGSFDDHGDGSDQHPSTNPSDIRTDRVLDRLETETQRVSQYIVSLSSSVERMHAVVDGAGPRGCVDALQSLLLSGGSASGSGGGVATSERVAITGNSRPSSRRGPRYGQVSSGTMT